ncbi:MAG TPA: AmmeMemoRadiSam system radical SAM enzyme [Ignavibacteriales bacterium]|nr:AmmeMemoRadiSam system radical SAM enzyme [Ignavibacteriales bacterium]HPP32431.1 AmmeMemoRadiSam system radical SAM enzyme [Ignavibacteriales bacterium]
MQEAKWYKNTNDIIKCNLCSHYCVIKDNSQGVCKVRYRKGDKLYTKVYGRGLSIAIDPIEKKPLYHFLPNTKILSLGTPGCNFHCDFCQNFQLSQYANFWDDSIIAPEQIIFYAKQQNLRSIAYTYNEPTIFGEYLYDVSKLAHTNKVKNVIVSNGYFAKETREELLQFINAANIDLKSLDKKFYSKIVGGNLQKVLENLIWIKRDTKIWLEITFLIIPTLNDSLEEFKNFASWIVDNIGPTTPIHINAFHPDYKLNNLPHTPEYTLKQAKEIFQKYNIKYIYLGNIYSDKEKNTYCPACNTLLIRRDFYKIENKLSNNYCPNCNNFIDGIF